jgi:hypothetical protein
MFDLFPAFTKITREGLNSIPRAVLSMIRPGPGISIFPTGDGGICISTQQQQGMQQGGLVGGGSGAGAIEAMGRVVSLDSGGNLINVNLWDKATSSWEVAVTQVYKPYEMLYSYWNGATVVCTDGRTYIYNAVALDKTYQRRANWFVGMTPRNEIQEITPAYAVGAIIYLFTTPDGYLADMNQLGRNWGGV